MDARDAKAFGALLAPGFIGETVDGKTLLADAMAQELASAPKDPNKDSASTIVEIRREGTTATSELQYHGPSTSLSAQGGAAQKIEVRSTSRDTWVESDGGWLLKSTVTQKLDATVNGKQVVHKEHVPPG